MATAKQNDEKVGKSDGNTIIADGVAFTDCQLLLIGKALADPRRYEILKRLAGHDCATECSEMRACIDISPATLSHHMKELEAAGLVRSEKSGKFVRYFPETATLSAYLDRLRSDLS